MGYLSLVRFGYLEKLVNPGPALAFTEDGILDQSGPAAGGIVPWTKVVSAQSSGVFLHRGVALYVDDPDELLLQSSGFRWLLQQCNYSLFGTPVHIPTDCLNITVDELMDKLYVRIQENKRRTVVDGPLRPGTPYAPLQDYLVAYVENPAAAQDRP